MNDKLEIILEEAVMAYSRYYPSTGLYGLKETAKILSQDSQCPSQDPN
jgi:hypothetical protein